MEKEENKSAIDNEEIKKNLDDDRADQSIKNELEKDKELEEDKTKEEKSSEEKIVELEDKLARTFAEMENQRRR